MHGLVNKAIESFVRDTHGPAFWREVADAAELGLDRFEPMLRYDDALTHRCLAILSDRVETPKELILEDIGTYLVSSRSTQSIRRLLRFGGITFTDFLISLDDLPDRVRLAVPDLNLPYLRVDHVEDHLFNIHVGPCLPGFEFVLLGVLRALADDYGTLVVIEDNGQSGDEHRVQIEIHEAMFAAGRSFELGDQRAVR